MKKVLEDGKKKDAQDNIVDYIIRLNKKCNFPSSMYIEKFFASVNIKDSFEITNNEKYYIKVLQNFNDLFYKVDAIFKKGPDFTYRYLKEFYFKSRSSVRRLIEKPSLVEQEIKNSYFGIYYCFLDGLIKFRYLYYIYYGDYENCSDFIHNGNCKEVSQIFLDYLSEEDILNIYNVHNYSSRILSSKKMIGIIEKTIIDIKKIPGVEVLKNEPNVNNEKLVKYFVNHVDEYEYKFKYFKIFDIDENVEIVNYNTIKLTSFKVKYKSFEFCIKFCQNQFKLYTYIYQNKKIIEKDLVYRVDDFDRIFLFISNKRHVKI